MAKRQERMSIGWGKAGRQEGGQEGEWNGMDLRGVMAGNGERLGRPHAGATRRARAAVASEV